MKPKRHAPAPATIATVERETGLSKDSLRVWERRYGFPRPKRDSNGERVYPADQVERLRMISRLIDGGFRPGKIVNAPMSELIAHARTLGNKAPAPLEASSDQQHVLQLLKEHRQVELRQRLEQMLMRLGVPIIFHSGHADNGRLLARYPEARSAGKPCPAETIASHLVQATSRQM